MSKIKPARTEPRIAGRQVYGHDELTARPGASVHLHRQKYHVFDGLSEILVTTDLAEALAEAAKKPTA